MENIGAVKMKKKGHRMKNILPESIASELGLESGDVLLAINGQEITDVFDYQYAVMDERIEVLIEKPSGEEWLLEIDKEYDEDLGVEFDNGLMDDYRSCHNKCIFCFIDQMPGGMRDTLYFKDDDSRLSFLQGNYVTLTNMSDHDIERIIRYHLSPINISFQTTNPKLRCMMLNNRFAGAALAKVDRLYEGGVTMNGQIVLCRGINDGAELERSIGDLTRYIPLLESVSVVPVGLSKYREGLYPLEPFTKEDAYGVLEIIHGWQQRLYAEHGLHFIHASDEWYILAGLPLPEAERYDGYPQLENGVGMLRLQEEEFREALRDVRDKIERGDIVLPIQPRQVSVATGLLACDHVRDMARRLMALCPGLTIWVYPIRNDFFGELITVSGLLTGGDLKNQLLGKELGEGLYLPENVLRSGEAVFLDDMTPAQLGNALQTEVNIVKSSGRDFVWSMLGM
jgi:putative radical SAM enzyme (TIGR03279 family)